MQAGRLRHRVQIQAPVETQNEFGEAETSWSTLASWWAHIKSKGGGEELVQGQYRSANMYEVRMRPYPGLTPRHRLLYDGRVFAISSVNNIDERGREMLLEVEEKV